LTPDEAVVQRGEGRACEGPQRREVLGEPRPGELEELERLAQVLESVASEGTKEQAAHGLVSRELPCRLRDHDLVAVPGCADARRDVDVEADVALLDELRLPGMEPDADAKGAVVRPGLVRERPLDVGGGGDRFARGGEREERSVTGPVHLVAVPPRSGVAHDLL
jgi:hypothetical protein